MVATKPKPKQASEETTKTPLPCPLCNNVKTKLLRTGIREDPECPVFKCPKCLLQYIEPRFTDVREYYRSQYRDGHDAVIGQRLTPEERFRQYWQSSAESAKRIMDFFPKGSSVLEIGCSAGQILDHMNQGGYDVFGAEWNPEDAAWVRDVGGIPCETGDIDEVYPGKKFDAIVALQVLEHQPDPAAFIRKIKDRLIGGGYLYLELPSASDALLTVYGIPEYKDFFYRESHVTYWEQETLAAFIGAMGFEAQVSIRQRYGLQDHMHWMMNHAPMPSFKEATTYMDFAPKEHPLHGILARTTTKLDKEYRVALETVKAADTIIAKCRRRTI
jgi:2-polyprenyl-3-methyl-5-hydroxy-6-metoxy-1,4-benzoquinol methylase